MRNLRGEKAKRKGRSEGAGSHGRGRGMGGRRRERVGCSMVLWEWGEANGGRREVSGKIKGVGSDGTRGHGEQGGRRGTAEV